VVAALADELGVPLLEWQKYVLDDALKILPNGRCSAPGRMEKLI
jgi:hypothetical protein